MSILIRFTLFHSGYKEESEQLFNIICNQLYYYYNDKRYSSESTHNYVLTNKMTCGLIAQ